MKQIAYQITLRQPVYARALGGDPNSGVSLGYIPGSLLRGVLLFKYAEKNCIDTKSLDAANPDIRRYFFNGETCFLNAYPVYKNERALPIPHSWQQPKDDKTKVYDFAVEEKNYDVASKCRGVSAAFWCRENRGVVFVKPERVLAVHNRRNREYGRAMERANMDNKQDDEGMVFRYEALAAGQVFRGLILCDDPDANVLHSLLNGEIFLGGSRTAGYGQAELSAVIPDNYSREVDGALPSQSQSDLTFTLLSDTIIRDDQGQFAAGADTLKLHLCRRLGIDAAQIADVSYLRSTIVGGFNRKWGLPLPQTIAVSMGSVIKLSGLSSSQDKLIGLETQGIGERRAEGFGRIAVNWPLMKDNFDVKNREAVPRAITSGSERPSVNGEGAQEMAKTMIKRIFRQKMDEKLVKWTQSLKFSPGNIRKSQISRLRNVLQNALVAKSEATNRALIYLEKIRKRQSIKSQFENTFIGQKKLLDWLDGMLQIKNTTAWQKIKDLEKANNGDPKQIQPHSIGSVELKLDDTEMAAMGIEYLLRYIDLVLANLAKKSMDYEKQEVKS